MFPPVPRLTIKYAVLNFAVLPQHILMHARKDLYCPYNFNVHNILRASTSGWNSRPTQLFPILKKSPAISMHNTLITFNALRCVVFSFTHHTIDWLNVVITINQLTGLTLDLLIGSILYYFYLAIIWIYASEMLALNSYYW